MQRSAALLGGQIPMSPVVVLVSRIELSLDGAAWIGRVNNRLSGSGKP